MDGNPVKLTPIEYRSFIACQNPEEFFASEIYERFGRKSDLIQPDTIMVHKKYSGEDRDRPENPKYLKVVGRWIQNRKTAVMNLVF